MLVQRVNEAETFLNHDPDGFLFTSLFFLKPVKNRVKYFGLTRQTDNELAYREQIVAQHRKHTSFVQDYNKTNMEVQGSTLGLCKAVQCKNNTKI